MELLLSLTERLAIAISAAQVGLVLVLLIVVIADYVIHRKVTAISLVSASHIILSGIIAGAMIYEMNASGWRFVVVALAITAFVIGDIALWMFWYNRTAMIEANELQIMSGRIDRQAERIERIEDNLRNEPAQVVLTAPLETIKVEIVEHEEAK